MTGGRPWRVALVGALLAAAVVLALLVAGGGLDSLIRASPEHTDAALAPIEVGEPGEGFDGQFYFRLAADPLSTDERVEGVAFDLPAVRAARIGYPALAGALALGQVGAIPASLVTVNVAAAGLVAGAAAAVARSGGRSGWWGLVVLAFPGFVYALGLDLGELVEAAAVLGALLAIRQGRTATAAASMALAVLTKETALALPVGIAVVTLLSVAPWPLPERARRSLRPGRPAVVSGAVGLAVAVAWQTATWARWGDLPLSGSVDKNIGLPLAGLVSARHAFVPTSGEALFRLGSLAVVAVAVGVAVHGMWPRAESAAAPEARSAHEPAALVVALVAATLTTEFVWAGATSFMRGLTEVWVLSLVVVLTRPAPAPVLPAVVALAAVGGTAETIAAEVAKRD